MSNDWEQISGDVTASEYGATFGQLDTIGDKVYGVRVVEIINMVEACGDDFTGKYPYHVETAYCDVDDVELSRMRQIMQSMGLESHRLALPEDYPDDIREHVEHLQGCVSDYNHLIAWQGALTDKQSAQLYDMTSELDTLRVWYTVPRMRRAEAMHSYGGYTDGQAYDYLTLKRAMDANDIPATALWRPSEYESVPSDINAGDGTSLDLALFQDTPRWTAHHDGTDTDGSEWHEYDMRGYLDMYNDGDSTCKGCGEPIESHCWYCPDGGIEDVYCPNCVDYHYTDSALSTRGTDSRS